MNILAIETSCDETAVCLLEESGGNFAVLGNALLSQIDVHREFGGVYPNLAKREHAKNLVPLFESVLRKADLLFPSNNVRPDKDLVGELKKLLEREPELFSRLAIFLAGHNKPPIDLIAVTSGPGLEPALWVGINFAKALSRAWNIPLVAVNHMEGHMYSSVLTKRADDTTYEIPKIKFPTLSLLISGGHTELVLARSWGAYEIMGETRDDAAGEAFDKVARMLGLPYPGGPEISRLAREARDEQLPAIEPLPRPMLDSNESDFSFSGLKTAVLYELRKHEPLTDQYRKQVAQEFEDAVSDVLIEKTKRALEETKAKTLIIGGGVSANTTIQNRFKTLIKSEFPTMALYIPEPSLTTDNAVMIAIAGFFKSKSEALPSPEKITAEGGLRLQL
jgi:N6-L-threonylcarbamoyladenine synthase